MELPARYTIRDYLKQQGKKLEYITLDRAEELIGNWNERYNKRRVDTAGIKESGLQYLEMLKNLGAFSIKSDYRPYSSISPNRERFLVSGYSLEPFGLGQGWIDPSPRPYVENAALLRCHIAEFKRKKASFGLGLGGVALTQHLLERIYERTEISRSDLASLLESEIPDLLRALALAEAASLWIQVAENGQFSRATAVPFSNGLLIANEGAVRPIATILRLPQ